MERVKKNIAMVVAAVLFLAGSYGAGSYTGKLSVRLDRPPAELIQQEQADSDKLYKEVPSGNDSKNTPAVSSGRQQEEAGQAFSPGPSVVPIGSSLGGAGATALQTEPREQAKETPDATRRQEGEQVSGKCVLIHDGDTINVRLDDAPKKLTKVRLIGIDAPELAPDEFGETARNYARSLLQNRRVILVYDRERYDKYGRTLAYVYLEDGTFINARLVEAGYAKTLPIPPNTSHAKEFEALQGKAKEAGRGIWANPPPLCTWRCDIVEKEWIF